MQHQFGCRSAGRRCILKFGAGLGSIATSRVTTANATASGKDPLATTKIGSVMLPDIDDIQLLFVDLQSTLMSASKTNSPTTISAAVRVLYRVGQMLNWPTTISVVSVAGKLIPELSSEISKNNLFPRTITDPFREVAFTEAVARHNRKTLIVSGFSTETAVLQTTFSALTAGYLVYVPVDAIGSRSGRTEAAAIREIERAGGVTTSVRSLLLRMTSDLPSKLASMVFAEIMNLEEY